MSKIIPNAYLSGYYFPASGDPTPGGYDYLRPDGTSYYKRPDGTSYYLRP